MCVELRVIHDVTPCDKMHCTANVLLTAAYTS